MEEPILLSNVSNGSEVELSDSLEPADFHLATGHSPRHASRHPGVATIHEGEERGSVRSGSASGSPRGVRRSCGRVGGWKGGGGGRGRRSTAHALACPRTLHAVAALTPSAAFHPSDPLARQSMAAHAKPLSLLPLVALIFFDVSGGPFGIEVCGGGGGGWGCARGAAAAGWLRGVAWADGGAPAVRPAAATATAGLITDPSSPLPVPTHSLVATPRTP